MTRGTGRLSGPKRELWLAWYRHGRLLRHVLGRLLRPPTRTQPPGRPSLGPNEAVAWFAARHWGLPIGFGLIFVLGGFSAVALALITYSIRRMSVSPVFAYSYLILYAVAWPSPGSCSSASP